MTPDSLQKNPQEQLYGLANEIDKAMGGENPQFAKVLSFFPEQAERFLSQLKSGQSLAEILNRIPFDYVVQALEISSKLKSGEKLSFSILPDLIKTLNILLVDDKRGYSISIVLPCRKAFELNGFPETSYAKLGKLKEKLETLKDVLREAESALAEARK